MVEQLLGTAQAIAGRRPGTLLGVKAETQQLTDDRGVRRQCDGVVVRRGCTRCHDDSGERCEGREDVVSFSARGPCVPATRNVVGNENSGYLW